MLPDFSFPFSFSVHKAFSTGNSNIHKKRISLIETVIKDVKVKFEKRATSFCYKFNKDSKTVLVFPSIKTHYENKQMIFYRRGKNVKYCCEMLYKRHFLNLDVL